MLKAQIVQNIVFAVVACVLLFSVIGCRAFYVAIGEKAPEYSDLERRDYQKLSGVLDASFADGKAQDLFEQFMADSVPMRDQVLLLNASFQRQGIESAAILCGFDVYHTFFGSKIIALRGKKIILEESSGVSTKKSAELNSLVRTLNKAAQKHTDIHFSCRFTQETSQTEMNPSYALKSGNRVDSAWAQANIIDALDSSLNAELDRVESFQEIEDSWFSTDPHWTLQRALKTYDSIAAQLGLDSAPAAEYLQVNSQWQGSYARGGLDVRYTSELWDQPIDFSDLHYFTIKEDALEEERVEPGLRAETLKSDDHQMAMKNPYMGYGNYYGAFNGLIVNEGQNNGRTCLFITDSFSHCLKRYVAANYEKTYCIMPGNYTTHLTLEKMIKRYKPDDVIYLTQVKKYNSFAAKSPEFLGLDADYAQKNDLDDADL